MQPKLLVSQPHPPQLLLGELNASFSRNDGNFLEALYPCLLSAVADIAEAIPKDGQSQDEPGTSSRRVELCSPPITWEEVREQCDPILAGLGDLVSLVVGRRELSGG